MPPPYTGSLVFTSKYEGSDSARATLNVKAEKTFRSQIKDITDMERGATKLVTQYMRSGRDGDLACALNWMSAWAAPAPCRATTSTTPASPCANGRWAASPAPTCA